MPRCEGRSTGPGQVTPCPDNKNDASVRSRQGDLYLCEACTESRFPSSGIRSRTTVVQSASTCQPRPAAVTRSSTAKNATESAHKETKKSAGTSAYKKPNKSEVKQAGKGVKKQSCSDCDDSASFCQACSEPVNGEGVITCDICCGHFHDVCTGLSNDTFKVLVTIVDQTGWVCRPCRTETNSMRSALSRTNEELADIRVSVKLLSDEMMKLKSDNHSSSSGPKKNPVPEGSSAASSRSSNATDSINMANNKAKPKTQIQMEVYLAMQDLTRRKSNVIVTGLPEPTDTTNADIHLADQNTFTRFCEENLTVKPAVSHKGCMRLGQQDGVRPRRLLVHLTSDEAASQVLQAAKSFNRNSRSSSHQPVYINPDLSPAEAKLAFERRQRRRTARAAETVTVNPSNYDYVQNSESYRHPAASAGCAPALPVVCPGTRNVDNDSQTHTAVVGSIDSQTNAGLNVSAAPFQSSTTPSPSISDVVHSPFH